VARRIIVGYDHVHRIAVQDSTNSAQALTWLFCRDPRTTEIERAVLAEVV
jgi:hypothetical protein